MSTPAQRVRARRSPAIRPPPAIRVIDRHALRNLTMYVAGRDYRIGANIAGDTPWEMNVEGAAMVTIPIASPDESLLDVLSDEALLQESGAKVTIDGVVYVLSACASDEDGIYTLTFEDEVAWRMRHFTSFRAANRKTVTRAGFAQQLVDEASRPPLEPMQSFIPELADRQRILRPEGQLTLGRTGTPAQRVRDGGARVSRGAGASLGITVKGSPASADQRAAIDAVLSECVEQGCSPRVMVAAIMCITQESDAGNPYYKGRGDWARADTVGTFQQGPEWISRANVMDDTLATRAFLLGAAARVGGTDASKRGWKQWHGLKNGPGNLPYAIHEVQRNADYTDYAPWEQEATRTVETWLGSDGLGPTTRVKRYEFTRGQRNGEREDSFAAAGRLAEEVGQRRWAAGNVFYFVSEDELRAAAPSVTISGDEGWLLAPPMWDWGSNRAVSEVTLRVAAERWGVMPGGVVVLDTRGPTAGRFIVKAVSGESIDSPEATITLKRPTRVKPEPAPETETLPDQQRASNPFGVEEADTSLLIGICRQFTGPYVYGGGHGPALSSLSFSQGLDCSSSTSLALWHARMFPFSSALVSGDFDQWGVAGRGREFSVMYNASHVWIAIHGDDKYTRFDTSPWGSGGSGPRLRTTPRDSGGFGIRHWPGR